MEIIDAAQAAKKYHRLIESYFGRWGDWCSHRELPLRVSVTSPSPVVPGLDETGIPNLPWRLLTQLKLLKGAH
jgi:hypothetical protein